MNLNGEDLKRFREGLIRTFPPSTGKLAIVVSDANIGINFNNYQRPDFESNVQTLLESAAGQEQLAKLFKAAVEAAPNNANLKEIKQYIDAFYRVIERVAPDHQDVERCLERVLFTNVRFEWAGRWLKELDQLRHRVCRIEPQPRDDQRADRGLNGWGTGFLVGPDVILTNYHVMSGFVDAANVRVRFDCEYDPNGIISEGRAFSLADNYEILGSRVEELDFALLRLKDPPAHDDIEGNPRGFFSLTDNRIEEREPLLILQHPLGEPLKLAFGSVSSRDNWTNNRLGYNVNTAGGSSGAPCLTQGLDVVALHRQGGLGSYNSGVLMSAIIDYWSQDDQAKRLKEAGLDYLVIEKDSVAPPSGPDINIGTPEITSVNDTLPLILREPIVTRYINLTGGQRNILHYIRDHASGNEQIHQDTIKRRVNEDSVYWRLETLYLMGLVEKNKAGRVKGIQQYAYKLSDACRSLFPNND